MTNYNSKHIHHNKQQQINRLVAVVVAAAEQTEEGTFLADDCTVVARKGNKSVGTTTINTATKISNRNYIDHEQRYKISMFRGKTSFSKFVTETESVRFKVHRPGCQCSKVRKIFNVIQEERKKDANHHDYNDEGFIIIPDCKTIKSIFIGGQVNSKSYVDNPLSWELTLHEVLFPLPQSIHGTPIKIACAKCMLQVEPNGFVCITSSSRSSVENARNMANESKKRRLEESNGVLHSDHANYVCVLRLSTLQKNSRRSHHGGSIQLQSSSSSSSSSRNRNGLHEELLQQNVPICNDTIVKIGHHLKRAIDFFRKDSKDNADLFIMTTVIVDAKHSLDGRRTVVLDIDIPGGKRHLGESSLECALRETLEETSLEIEKSWIVDVDHPLTNTKDPDESCNVFYQVLPPSSSNSSNSSGGSSSSSREQGNDRLDDLLKDVFWKNTGLD